jgi:hypothetical protein
VRVTDAIGADHSEYHFLAHANAVAVSRIDSHFALLCPGQFKHSGPEGLSFDGNKHCIDGNVLKQGIAGRK